MNSQLVTAVLMLLGAGTMAVCLLATRRVLTLLKGSRYLRWWRVLLVMMVFFLLGYFAAAVMVLAGQQALILLLTGVVFLFGALFVLIVVFLGRVTIEDLLAARETAEADNRAKSTFLANMSHELRTPLNHIIGYSEILQEEVEELGHAGLAPDLERIHSAGKHLLRLITDVLDFAKIEVGRMGLDLDEFEIGPAVRDVVATVQPLMNKNANQLQVNVPTDLGVMHSDATKLRQALYNVLSNAAKFTDRGLVTLEVTRGPLPTAGQGDWISVRVSDTGIGLTPEQLRRMFEPFAQGDSSTSRKYAGTGLGMAITRKMCQLMGGDITVASEAGQGTTFTLQLPVDAQRAQAPASLRDGRAPEAAADRRAVVLSIDDDPAARELIQRYLARAGFSVVGANSGAEGLQLARALKPKVILLDVMMPGMDGWEVLTVLKGDPALADIPVVILTIVDNKNMGYALGAADYLVKPIERERLVTVLRKYLPGQTSGHVLVVDDDEPTREMLRRTLEKEGLTVALAENGRAALTAAEHQRPELVLLDLMMPEMDGFAFAAEFRRRTEWRAVPIVVVTAKDLTAEDRRRLSGQVEKVLQKGAYTREALLAEVRDQVASLVKQAK